MTEIQLGKNIFLVYHHSTAHGREKRFTNCVQGLTEGNDPVCCLAHLKCSKIDVINKRRDEEDLSEVWRE